jgi:hypothetical protein
MFTMREMMRRCLSLGLSLTVIVFSGMRSKKASAEPGKREATESLPQPVPVTAEIVPIVSFTGTVVRDGSRFALRDAAGALFALDSTGRAWPFEGEDVTVCGVLDPTGTVLHIHGIHAVDDFRAEAV